MSKSFLTRCSLRFAVAIGLISGSFVAPATVSAGIVSSSGGVDSFTLQFSDFASHPGYGENRYGVADPDYFSQIGTSTTTTPLAGGASISLETVGTSPAASPPNPTGQFSDVRGYRVVNAGYKYGYSYGFGWGGLPYDEFNLTLGEVGPDNGQKGSLTLDFSGTPDMYVTNLVFNLGGISARTINGITNYDHFVLTVYDENGVKLDPSGFLTIGATPTFSTTNSGSDTTFDGTLPDSPDDHTDTNTAAYWDSGSEEISKVVIEWDHDINGTGTTNQNSAGFGVGALHWDQTAIPEPNPSVMVAIASGLCLGFFRRRREKQPAQHS